MNSFEFTGNMRWVQGVGSDGEATFTLQQQWGRRNNWAWHSLEWRDVPTVKGYET